MPIDVSMTIPEPEAAPKEGSLPSHFPPRNNLAGDKDLVNEVRGLLSTQLECFRTQDARVKYVDAGGTMDGADRAWRVATRRDTTNSQNQDSLSDVASSAFYRAIRALTSGENAIFFQGTELPARYEHELNTDDYIPEDGKSEAERRNLMRDYTWERDDRRLKIKKGNLYKNKDGLRIWGMEWGYAKEERFVKVKNETTGKIERVKREVVTKEWPELCAYDVNNVYADAYIPELQNQRAVFFYDEKGYETYAEQQRLGYIKNVDQITASQASSGETDDQLHERRKNAGESPEVRQTGMLREWTCWARLSIKETKRPGRGKIDRKVQPEWYWCTFVGGTERTLQGAVCIRLIKNPYNHKKLPYYADYAYHDNKGFYHVAPWNLVESTYWQVVTNINQAIDNTTLRNRTPYTVDGPIRTRDCTARANQIIKLAKGTTLTPLTVPETTRITMEMKAELESEILKALGITQTIEGVPLGGRTSAAEAGNDLDQAQKPLLQKADENGQGFYQWLMWSDAELWDQFADPALVLAVSHLESDPTIRPAEIYGPFKVKVTAVTEYENRATRRRELSGIFQSGMYDRMAEIMPTESKSILFRQVGNEFGLKRVPELFPPVGDRDAMRRATAESFDMLRAGEFVAAEQGENHSVHLEKHESFLRESQFLPDGEQNPEWQRMLQGHIEQHQNFVSEISQRQAPAQQEGSNAAIASNAIEAQAGAQANLG